MIIIQNTRETIHQCTQINVIIARIIFHHHPRLTIRTMLRYLRIRTTPENIIQHCTHLTPIILTIPHLKVNIIYQDLGTITKVDMSLTTITTTIRTRRKVLINITTRPISFRSSIVNQILRIVNRNINNHHHHIVRRKR